MRLTVDVPMMDVEDMQWHVIEVPHSWVWLLKQVAIAILCYRDVHGDALPLD